MNLYYLFPIIIIELLMIAMLVHVITYSGFTRKQKTWFILTFAFVMLCAAAELAVHYNGEDYNIAFKIPLTILTVIQFSASPFLGVFFSGALGMRNLSRKVGMGFLLNAVVEIVAAPFGWIFYFGDDGKYHRGDLFPIYVAFYMLSLVYLIICMILTGKKFHHRDTITIIMILVILVTGIVPMVFNTNVAYISVGACSCLAYIYYNDLVQQDIAAEVADNQKKISSMQEHIISGLANLIENRDMETGEHVARTSAYVKLLAELCVKDGVYTDKLNKHFIELLYTLAPMHDIGKIVVSDRILKKPGKLTPEEYEEMKKHAAVGGDVVREVLNGITDEEYVEFASDIATYHHERWDGKGYPKGLKEEEIPLSARIMAIADVFDALVSERCYKKPIPYEQAFKIMEEDAGHHFDPKLIEVFLKHKEDFENINITK